MLSKENEFLSTIVLYHIFELSVKGKIVLHSLFYNFVKRKIFSESFRILNIQYFFVTFRISYRRNRNIFYSKTAVHSLSFMSANKTQRISD